MRVQSCSICGLLAFLVLASGNSSAATFTVANTNDMGAGSLRNAITSANTNVGLDTIDFAIAGAGPHTIFPLSQLPPLSDRSGLIIDGFTQPGATPGANPPSTANILIVLDGSNAGPSHGLWIVSPVNTVQGLVINNFEQDGIRIQGTQYGTHRNYIFCNFVGTDQTGNTAQGNGTNQTMYWAGVNIIVTPDSIPRIASENIVEANLISANYAEGVGISNCPPGDVFGNVVIGGNYIGTDVTGMVDLGNAHDGVYIGEGAHDNLVVEGNLISGNDFEGVCIVGYAELQIYTNANLVADNIIGLTINLTPLPNTRDGVSIGRYGTIYSGGYATRNAIAANIIAHNGRNGVLVWEHPSNAINADGNPINQNSMYENGLLGIDLADDGVTMNDPADPDDGPNQELNFPVIASAVYSPGQTTVTGTVDIDTDPTWATVEVFKARPDPTNYGEGEEYVDSATPDSLGSWFVIDTLAILAPGDYVTATTTDSTLNTSEFCECVVVTQVGAEEFANDQLPMSNCQLLETSPNPFRHTTTILYRIPPRHGDTEMRGHGDVSTYQRIHLSIYDLSGRLVKTLVDEPLPTSYSLPVPSEVEGLPTSVVWDGRNETGRRVSAGVYFCRLQMGGFRAVRRLILIR